jgi:chromosome segregation ATPase
MENYVDGNEYFIKGKVRSGELPGRPVEFSYDSGYGTNCGVLADEPGLLLTAEEVAGSLKTKADVMEVVSDSLQEENEELKTKVERLTTWYEEANRTASEATEANDELKAKIAELRTHNAELEALLKEVTATRDEAIRQNNVLLAEIKKLKYECNELKDAVDKRIIDVLIDRIVALKKGENDG